MEEIYEQTPMQKQIYIYSRMFPKDPAYNLNFLFKLNGQISYAKLITAIENTFNSKEVFKANFIKDAGRLSQRYCSDRVWSMRQVSLDNIEKIDDKVKYVKDKVDQEANLAMDLNKWPLFEVTLYKSDTVNFLYFKLHHVLMDIYTIFQIFEEISMSYNLDLIPKSNNGITCFDLKMNKMNSNCYEQALDYFKDEFGNFDDLSISELDEERTKEGLQIGSYIDYHVDKKVVLNLCDKLSVTPFQLFLSIYVVVISIITRNKKIIIGIPIENRRSEFKKTPGLYVNNLPLNVDLSRVETFIDLVNYIKNKMSSIKKYKQFDFKENLKKIYSYKSNPLNNINNSITYWKQAVTLELKGVETIAMKIDEKYLKFPFSIILVNTPESYILHVETINKFNRVDFGGAYKNILNQVNENSSVNICNISLINNQEKQVIVETINKHKTNNFRTKSTVIDRFEQMVREYPEDIAVKSENSSITYKDLDMITNRIANHLENNIEQNNIVVSISPSIHLIIIILSVMKSGKTYIPLDDQMPLERKTIILEQLDNAVIYTKTEYIDVLNKYGFNCYLASDLIQQSLEENDEMCNKCNFNHPAYILFTSGSTGRPKGVVINHKNIASLFESAADDFNFSSKDNWILFHSYGFDYAMFEIFGALTFGGKLVIVPQRTKKFPDEFRKLLIKEKISVLTQTPSSFSNLVTVESMKSEHLLNDIKYVFVGAESVHFEQFDSWSNIYGLKSPEIYNLYGITEASVISTFHKITYEDIEQRKSNIIGTPLRSVDTYVVDLNGNVLPIGLEGELIIAGDSVGEGYYHNEKQTKEQFYNNNRINRNFRTFKTGDLVIVNENSEIKYLNRIDSQVQISGHRVETGEIENAIRSYNDCLDSIVISHEFGPNDTRLIGYYIAKDTETFDKKYLLNYLKKKLQSYMIPSFLISIKEKPLTLNGKLNNKKLPIPNIKLASKINNNNHCGNLTSTQKILFIWEKVLNNINISEDDNFFDVGGTSMLISEVYFKILNEFNLSEEEISMIDLFDFSSPKAIGAFIDKEIAFICKNLTSSQKVLHIWEEVLNNVNISEDDNFFDVGGTSMLIAEVYFKILNEFKLSEEEISMIDLFDFSSPKAIGAFIDKKIVFVDKEIASVDKEIAFTN